MTIKAIGPTTIDIRQPVLYNIAEVNAEVLEEL